MTLIKIRKYISERNENIKSNDRVLSYKRNATIKTEKHKGRYNGCSIAEWTSEFLIIY